MKTIKPLFSQLVVRRDAQAVDEKSVGGLYVPSIAQEKPVEGTVLAIGDWVEAVHVDDRVLFGKYAGVEFRLNDEDLLLMKEEDVVGVVTEDAF